MGHFNAITCTTYAQSVMTTKTHFEIFHVGLMAFDVHFLVPDREEAHVTAALPSAERGTCRGAT